MSFVAAPVIILAVYLLVDLYLLRSAILPRRSRKLTIAFLTIEAIGFLSMAIIPIMGFRDATTPRFYFQSVMMTVSLIIFIPSLLYTIVDLIGSIPCLFHRHKWRRTRIAATTIAVASLLLMTCGIFNRKRITVDRLDLNLPSLPASFDGLTIAHISDLHLGSFASDTTFIRAMVDRINALNPDLILFTGDIVSRRADEMLPFLPQLSRLKAREGIFAVLGNHDYGLYVDYPNPDERYADHLRLRKQYELTSFTLLADSIATIARGADSILIVGTENISYPPYPSFGMLHEVCPDCSSPQFKILLTHDPVFWTDSIAPRPDNNFALTLSGHTHAMQCQMLGISPSALQYKAWGGHYASPDSLRHINVNTGIGTVGPLMRIGATPQITFITLHHGQ